MPTRSSDVTHGDPLGNLLAGGGLHLAALCQDLPRGTHIQRKKRKLDKQGQSFANLELSWIIGIEGDTEDRQSKVSQTNRQSVADRRWLAIYSLAKKATTCPRCVWSSPDDFLQHRS